MLYDTEQCDMACAGNSTEACGGPWKLSVYRSKRPGPGTNSGAIGYASLGCFQDWIEHRVLTYTIPVEGGPAGMTVSKCTSACHARGYAIAGLEYGGGMMSLTP